MANYDVREFLEDDAITLEGITSPAHPHGKAYTFASPSFETGLWLKNLIEFGQNAALGLDQPKDTIGKLTLNDDEELDLYQRVMGATFNELRADNVSWERTRKIFTLLLRHWGSGQSVAVTLQDAAGEAAARSTPDSEASETSSSPTVGSKSNRASSGTKAPTAGQGSTRSSATSARKRAPRKAS